MKLYATTTSERASKGQGGNKYLNIEITDSNQNILGIIQLKASPDGSKYVLPVLTASFDSRCVLVKSVDSNYRFQQSKGEKKKDEKCPECGSDIDKKYLCCSNNSCDYFA